MLLSEPAFAERSFMVDAYWLAAGREKQLVILEERYHPQRYFAIWPINSAVPVQRFRNLGGNLGRSIQLFPGKDAFKATLCREGANDSLRSQRSARQ